MEPAKWEAVVREAARAFARHGFKKASIDEIARAAGVAKGTVYLGCESKRDLFYQAILRDLRLWNASLARLIDPRVPADELLVRVARAAMKSLDEHPLARDLILDVYAADLPDYLDRLEELRAESLTTVREILRIGIRQRRFRADLETDLVAGVFLDLMTATLMFHARTPQGRFDEHAAAALEVFLHGIAPRAKPRR